MTDGPRLVASRERNPPIPWRDIKPSAKPWLVKGVLPAKGVGFLVGTKSAGKTFVAIDWAARLAFDLNVLDRRSHNVGVVYIAAEDPDGCINRCAAWRKANKALDGPIHLYTDPVALLDRDQVAGLREDLAFSAEVFEEGWGVGLGLVVIDTLSWCISGLDENSSQDMSRVFRALSAIANDFECLVLVVAHYGKNGEERGIRGWSGMDAYSDATIAVERAADDPELRHLSLAKVKNGADGHTVAFRLKGLELDELDADREPLTSALVEYEERSAAKPKGRRLGGSALFLVQAIDRMREQGRIQNLPRPSDVPAVWKAYQLSAVRAECEVVGLYTEDDTPSNKRLKWHRAITELNRVGRLKILGPTLWSA